MPTLIELRRYCDISHPFELRRTLFEMLHNILRLPNTGRQQACIWLRTLLYITVHSITVTIPSGESLEMEFFDINLTKDSSLLFRAIHSPFYWRILKKTILFSGFKNHRTRVCS
jgi:hypothetical protein